MIFGASADSSSVIGLLRRALPPSPLSLINPSARNSEMIFVTVIFVSPLICASSARELPRPVIR